MKVPLEVRLDGPDGSQIITRHCSDIRFGNVDPGGYSSVEVDLLRPLDSGMLSAFSDILVFDARNGEQVGGGRLADQGRTLDSSRQVWALSALGEGLASTQDTEAPYFLIDSSLENWKQRTRTTRRVMADQGQHPDEAVELDGLLFQAEEDKTIAQGAYAQIINRVAQICGQEVGALGFRHDAGANSSDWRVRWGWFNSDFSAGTAEVQQQNWSVTATSRSRIARTDLGVVRNVAAITWIRTAAAYTASEAAWNIALEPIVQAMTLRADGTPQPTSWYNVEAIYAHEVFVDVLARRCPRLDITHAAIELGTFPFRQLCWIDGITALQVLEEVLAVESALTWAAWGKNPDTGRWDVELRTKPTTVRYEATADGGFSGPSPQSEVYNRAVVRGRLSTGRQGVAYRTSTVPELDAAGIVRTKTIDLGDEVFTEATAAKRGDAFLAEHAAAPNAGSLTLAAPVQDSLTGRLVPPWAIRSGELIRVRGLQPSPNTFNSTGPNGSTVFRIVSASYSSSSNTVDLELDSRTLTEARAIADLIKARKRKR